MGHLSRCGNEHVLLFQGYYHGRERQGHNRSHLQGRQKPQATSGVCRREEFGKKFTLT